MISLPARPRYDAPLVPEEPYRADRDGNQQIVPTDTQASDAAPIVSSLSSRSGPYNTDAGKTPISRRVTPEDPIEGASPSVQGTVFLDSASFGRWVVDHLTREITRPANGMTGFDPRITASYPGAPIGG